MATIKAIRVTLLPLVAHLTCKGYKYKSPQKNSNQIIFPFPDVEGLAKEIKAYHEGTALVNPAEYADTLHRVRVLVRSLLRGTEDVMEVQDGD